MNDLSNLNIHSFNDILERLRTYKGVKKELVFSRLKSNIIGEIHKIIYEKRTTKRGPLIKVNLDKILDTLFLLANGGIQINTAVKLSGVSLNTFYKYYNLVNDHELFKKVWKIFLGYIYDPLVTFTDSMSLKSKMGSSETGYNFKQKGKKGVKLTLLTDFNKVIYNFDVHSANVDDRNAFLEMLEKDPPVSEIVTIADAGYVGKIFSQKCALLNCQMLAIPRRSSRHFLNISSSGNLSYFKQRPRIEHVNSTIASYRGLEVKYTKSIKRYNSTLVSIAVLCTSIVNYSKTRPNMQLTGKTRFIRIRRLA